jgi:hypothetical protein
MSEFWQHITAICIALTIVAVIKKYSLHIDFSKPSEKVILSIDAMAVIFVISSIIFQEIKGTGIDIIGREHVSKGHEISDYAWCVICTFGVSVLIYGAYMKIIGPDSTSKKENTSVAKFPKEQE